MHVDISTPGLDLADSCASKYMLSWNRMRLCACIMPMYQPCRFFTATEGIAIEIVYMYHNNYYVMLIMLSI